MPTLAKDKSWNGRRKNSAGDAASTVIKVIDTVTESCAEGMYEFDALWTGNHSRFPTLEYLDSHVCGPYREVKRIKGMMGNETFRLTCIRRK